MHRVINMDTCAWVGWLAGTSLKFNFELGFQMGFSSTSYLGRKFHVGFGGVDDGKT